MAGRRRMGLALSLLGGATVVAILVVAIGTQGDRGDVGVWSGGETGLSLQLEGGHRAILAPAATLRIDETSDTRFRAEVARGRVVFEVAPRRDGDLFRVDFAGHHLEVRGTAFDVEVTPAGGAGVVVRHGVVDVYRDHRAVNRLRQGDRWSSATPEPAAPETPAVGSRLAEIRAEPPDDGVTPVTQASPEASDAPHAPDGPHAEAPEAVADAQPEPELAVSPEAEARTPTPREAGAADAATPKPGRDAGPRSPNVVVREVRIEAPAPVAVEPLSPSVESALLASLRAGDCARAEKALAALVRAHGPATPGEVWWMRAWCARRGGDLERSRRWFGLASGRVSWPIPAGDELPPLP